MDFTQLTDARKAEILKAQIVAFEEDAYGHLLNIDRLTAARDGLDEKDPERARCDEAITTAEKAVETIASARDVTVAKLDELDEKSP